VEKIRGQKKRHGGFEGGRLENKQRLLWRYTKRGVMAQVSGKPKSALQGGKVADTVCLLVQRRHEGRN